MSNNIEMHADVEMHDDNIIPLGESFQEPEKQKQNSKYAIIIGMLVTIGSGLLYSTYNNYKHPLVCTEESQVVDIVSLAGRSATIKLENGKTLELQGVFLNKGDNYCLKSERKN